MMACAALIGVRDDMDASGINNVYGIHTCDIEDALAIRDKKFLRGCLLF